MSAGDGKNDNWRMLRGDARTAENALQGRGAGSNPVGLLSMCVEQAVDAHRPGYVRGASLAQ